MFCTVCMHSSPADRGLLPRWLRFCHTLQELQPAVQHCLTLEPCLGLWGTQPYFAVAWLVPFSALLLLGAPALPLCYKWVAVGVG